MAFKALLATKTAEKISTTLVEMDEKDLMPRELPDHAGWRQTASMLWPSGSRTNAP